MRENDQVAVAVSVPSPENYRTAVRCLNRRAFSRSKIDARITRLFPFELTKGQRRAIDEIAADMARPFPMNRLLQGDVGSGKTVVAMYAILLAVAHGYQAALMAPTDWRSARPRWVRTFRTGC